MWHRLIRLDNSTGKSLQVQLREALVSAILDGLIPIDCSLPSTRELSRQLGIARNTVVLAYQHLLDENYLIARERQGHFVNPEILQGRVSIPPDSGNDTAKADDSTGADQAESVWRQRVVVDLTDLPDLGRPVNWEDYDYPFIYGQVDPSLFPVNDWRECCRLSLQVAQISDWSADRVDHDNALLVEQILTRILPRRGVWAGPENLLITNGAQNALYLLAQLLLDKTRVVGLEDPCYIDGRLIFSQFARDKMLFPVGVDGVQLDERAADCDLIYVTPSHQCPTTTTLPLAKRRELLEMSERHDFLVIEDDYESELNFTREPRPALKSLDENDRVIYVGSLSKTLAPGLRIGYMVGSKSLIRQARALRRLMYRHPATNNQLVVGHFLSLGHHDAVMLRISKTLKARWLAMHEALSAHSALQTRAPVFGGSSFWVALPASVSASRLEKLAAAEGIIVNSGDHYFSNPVNAGSYLRLGFSSIEESRIRPGIDRLAALLPRA